jgi:serine-type D-Ala-D-Ala carboxypeptidase
MRQSVTTPFETCGLKPAPTSRPAKVADQAVRFRNAFDIIEQAIAGRAFPGAALAVSLGGELRTLSGFGRFTFEESAPQVAAETIFDVASLTKPVATVTMAMMLYQRGFLDLDATAASVVAELDSSPDPGSRQITFRMLLTHSSGLPAHLRLFEGAKGEELFRAACSSPLEAVPGTRAEYSDIGFIVLGKALERLADDTLDSFCRREIFGPLGMMCTMFRPPAAMKSSIPPAQNDSQWRRGIVQGEVDDENASAMGGVAGHAGLFSTASDLAAFANCMLKGGEPILRPQTVELFTTRQNAPKGSSWALGWDTPSAPSQSGKYFSPRSYGHLGFTGTSLWVDPERQLSVTFLTNRTWPDRRSEAIKQVRPALHNAIVEALNLT